MFMKKHLFGICVALFFAVASFYVSPIQFYLTAMAQTMSFDGATGCHAYPHISNHFVQVFDNVCFYETTETAKYRIESKVDEFTGIIEPLNEFHDANNKTYKRAVVRLERNGENYFCVVRQDRRSVTNICSTSLRHTLEFEQQEFVKFNKEK
jgi:hypothetical protein